MQDDRLSLAPVVIGMLGTDVGRVGFYPILQFWFSSHQLQYVKATNQSINQFISICIIIHCDINNYYYIHI